MAYPYAPLAVNKADGTPTPGDLAPAINALGGALNDLLTLLGPTAPGLNSELAYAEIVANFVNPSAAENDVVGLTDIPVVAGARPFYVEFVGAINNATTGQGHQVKIYRKTGVGGAYAAVYESLIVAALNNTIYARAQHMIRQSGLVAGTTYYYKVTIDTINTGALTIWAGATYPAFLRAHEAGI